jgi:hypothetical protein
VECVIRGIKLDAPENVTAVANGKSRGPPISTIAGMIESESGKRIQVDQLLSM